LLLDEDRLRHDGRHAAGTQERSKSSHDMDEKDDEIAHLSILARTANPWNCALNQQFARDRDLFLNVHPLNVLFDLRSQPIATDSSHGGRPKEGLFQHGDLHSGFVMEPIMRLLQLVMCASQGLPWGSTVRCEDHLTTFETCDLSKRILLNVRRSHGQSFLNYKQRQVNHVLLKTSVSSGAAAHQGARHPRFRTSATQRSMWRG